MPIAGMTQSHERPSQIASQRAGRVHSHKAADNTRKGVAAGNHVGNPADAAIADGNQSLNHAKRRAENHPGGSTGAYAQDCGADQATGDRKHCSAGRGPEHHRKARFGEGQKNCCDGKTCQQRPNDESVHTIFP